MGTNDGTISEKHESSTHHRLSFILVSLHIALYIPESEDRGCHQMSPQDGSPGDNTDQETCRLAAEKAGPFENIDIETVRG